MTTESKKFQLETSVDATGARQGFEQVKQAGKDAAEQVKKSSEQASKATEKIGEGAQKSAGEVEKADSRVIASLQRRMAAVQSAGKGEAAYQEQLLKNRGLNVDLYRPYLDGLKQAEAAQKAATSSLGTMGVSAAQTAAALRGVPAQFTDIVTALQGGQQPLTVFLQQGGQLKDMFGGAGAAAKALGGYVVGLINPFTLLAAGVGAVALGYYKGSQEAQEFQKTLILTGNAAGVTAGQLSQMAAAVGAMGGATQGRASEVLNQLAASGGIGAANMQRFTAAALELERVGGPAVDATIKAFLELGRAPLEASIKLNEAQNYLTQSTYEQIKALEEQGRFTDAARVAQEAYSSAIENRTPEIVKNLGLIQRGWIAVATESKRALDAVLNIGREETDVEKLARLQQTLAERQRNSRSQYGSPDADPAVAALQKQIELLSRRVLLSMEAAAAEGQFKEAVRASLSLSQDAAKYDSDLEKQRKAIATATEKYQVALASGNLTAKERNKLEEDYLKTVNGILASKGTGKQAGDSAAKQELEAQKKLMAELAGLSGDFYKEWDRLNALFKAGKLNTEQLTEAQGKLLAKQTAIRDEAKAQAEAQKSLFKAYEEAAKAYDKRVEAMEKSADSIADQLKRAQDEEQAAMLAAAANISLAQAIQQVAVARLQEQQAAEAKAGNQEAVDAIEKEIKARRELITIIGNKDARDAAKKSADKAAEDWKRAAEKIEDAITDSLMRGFESGKGFAENLRDTVEAMFKTLVLRPIVSAVVQPLAQSLTGLSGLGGLSNAASLASGAGAFYGLGGLVSGAGSLLGSSTISAFGSGLGMTSAQAAQAAAAYNAAGMGGTASAIGAGNMLASAMPWLAGAGLIYSLAKSLDNSGTPHTGGAVSYSAAGGLMPGAVAGNGWTAQDIFGQGSGVAYSADTTKMLGELSKSVVGILDSTATSFGKTAGYTARTGYADDSSSDGSFGALTIKVGDRAVIDWGANRESSWAPRSFADGQTGLDEYLAAVAGDVKTALNQIGLPAWATKMLDGLGNAPAVDELAAVVATINATEAALVGLGDVMPQFANLTDSATQILLDSFGGIEGLATSAQGFYQNFYTEAERAAKASELVSAALGELGYTMPTTREQFKQWVTEQLALGDAGATTAAELLKLQGSVAELVPWATEAADAVDQTAKALEEMAEAGRRALADIANDTGSLMVELLRAQGDAAGALALERQRAIDAATSGLSETDRVAWAAAYDYNQALRDQIDALLAATSAQKQAEEAAKQAADAAIAEAQARARAVEQEAYGLTTRLLQAQGNTAELRRRELEALDPTNRSLLEQIYALEDQKSAAQAAALAAEEAARLQQEAAREATRAAEEQARAAEQIRDAWQSVTDSLLNEAKRIRDIAAGDAGMSYQQIAAKFGSTTSLARAGDQEAAKLLPELSQTMLTLAEAQATSLAELQRIRARTAASLEQTSLVLASQYGLTLPKFAAGTNYVPQDMAAIVHKGEAIVPAQYNPAAGGTNRDDELLSEVRALRDDNRAQALRIVQLSAELNRIVKTWDANGLPTERVEV